MTRALPALAMTLIGAWLLTEILTAHVAVALQTLEALP